MHMRERPNSGWTRIVLLLAILLSTLLVAVGRIQIGKSTSSSGASVAPLTALLSIPLRRIETAVGSVSARTSAMEDNALLREEVAMLRERQARYDNLARKVARYEAILGVDTQTDIPLRKIAARAIAETDGPFVRSLLITAGTRQGVAEGNPVMSVEGLVGHVINAGPNTSRVLRLSDLNSRIAVASAETGATAILAGDNTLRPKLSFANQREAWAIGHRVISSGDDGALPRGLAVGEVVSDAGGTLRVRLSSRNAPLDWVWVSPYQPIALPDPDITNADQTP